MIADQKEETLTFNIASSSCASVRYAYYMRHIEEFSQEELSEWVILKPKAEYLLINLLLYKKINLLHIFISKCLLNK